jgi:Uma2 family endonuclease
MATKPLPTITLEQYIQYDNEAEGRGERRSEFLNGHMAEVEAATENHSLIVINLAGEVRSALKESSCRVYSQDLRVYMPLANECAYPDLVIVCGNREFARGDILLNPLTIIEVLSPSTEQYNRGNKFSRYRSIASLREYILISQDEMKVEQWCLIGDGAPITLAGKWMLNATYTSAMDILEFGGFPFSIPLSEIYRNVVWEERETTNGSRSL